MKNSADKEGVIHRDRASEKALETRLLTKPRGLIQ